MRVRQIQAIKIKRARRNRRVEFFAGMTVFAVTIFTAISSAPADADPGLSVDANGGRDQKFHYLFTQFGEEPVEAPVQSPAQAPLPASPPDSAPADDAAPTSADADAPTPQQVFAAICAAGISHPEIVIRQAMLETGRLKSPMLMRRNNLFGFKNAKYLTFASWRDSVVYYKKWQQARYVDTSEDYFHFLTRIRYAAGDYAGYVMQHKWDDTCPVMT